MSTPATSELAARTLITHSSAEVTVVRRYRPGWRWLLIADFVLFGLFMLGALCLALAVFVLHWRDSSLHPWSLFVMAMMWLSPVAGYAAGVRRRRRSLAPGDAALVLGPAGVEVPAATPLRLPWDGTAAKVVTRREWSGHPVPWLELRRDPCIYLVPLAPLGLTAEDARALVLDASGGRCVPQVVGKRS